MALNSLKHLFMLSWYSTIHLIVNGHFRLSSSRLFNIIFSIGGRDLQIMLDALCSKDGILGTRKEDYQTQDVPLYWSNVSYFSIQKKVVVSHSFFICRMI